MKKLFSFGLFALILTACAPAAGRPAIQIIGTTQDMVNAAVAACPTIAPSGYNFLSVETIADNFVTCSAQLTTGLAIIDAISETASPDQKLTVSFSSVRENIVQVAISSFPKNSEIEAQLELALHSSFNYE